MTPYSKSAPRSITPSTSRPERAQLRGIVLLLGAILLWGANWPVMKTGLSHITPVWLSASRFILGALCLFMLQGLTGKLKTPPRQDWALVASVGLLQMMTFTLLGAIAMTEVPAGRSAVLAYTTPLWVTPIAVLFFRESLSRRQLIGSVLGLAGVVILFNPFTFNWSDHVLVEYNLMLLLASFTWAMCILHLRHQRGASSAYELAPWQMLLASIPLTILARVTEGPYSGDGSASLIAALLFMGPLATAFCFVAVNAASMWLSSTRMATAMLGVPIIGLLMSVIFLGEQLTPTLTLGMAVITGGIFVVTVTPRLAR